jgi:Uncharacterized conserved protein
MQLPEKVSFNWQSVLQKAFLENTINIHEIVSENSEINVDLKNANTAYEYWDKIQYTVLPENISPELFWAIVKFQRSALYSDKIKLGIYSFKYLLNPAILKKLAFIDSYNIKCSLSLDEENEYYANAKMEEAIASSRLEGASVSNEEAKEMLRVKAVPSNESEKMVYADFAAMNFIEKNLNKELSPQLIKELYGVITDEKTENIFRSGSDGVRVVDIRDDAVLYEPPKAESIEDLLNLFCEYVNGENEPNHIIKAIIIHFLLAYIHPFADGNGRIARVLFYWYMLKHRYNGFKYLAISKVLRVIAPQYAKVFLYTEIDENDLTYFINFNLDVIIEAVNSFESYLENKKEGGLTAETLISSGVKLNLRQQSILKEFIKNNNIRNIEYFKNKLGVVYETVRKDLMFLTKKGFLAKSKAGKEFMYSLSKKYLQRISEIENKQQIN